MKKTQKSPFPICFVGNGSKNIPHGLNEPRREIAIKGKRRGWR
jgi:hypothetical protein